jgi:signal transduction histidine kinase
VRVDPRVVVRADREKLGQILLNLLSNAVKFTDSGGRVAIDTASRADAPAGVSFIRIADTGLGIVRDRQEMIFDPFVQVHRNLRRNPEGTGLGLAISRDLARGMSGDLRVRSVDGEGSRFTLTLPSAQG